jgi:hypothetical protein
VTDKRGCGGVTGPLAALVRTRDRAGGGWLLAELEKRFGYNLYELARRFDRSVSWVSRRLALVEVLPQAIQQLVREGKILAQVALKFLVPVARQSLEDCQRIAAIFAQHHCDTREAGQLYAAWRKGSPAIRKRILDDPELFFKARRQAQEKAPAGTGAELLRDLEMMARHREPSASSAGGRRCHGVGSPTARSRAASDRPHSQPAPPHRRNHPTGEETAC